MLGEKSNDVMGNIVDVSVVKGIKIVHSKGWGQADR
jgi:hypothetical protein